MGPTLQDFANGTHAPRAGATPAAGRKGPDHYSLRSARSLAPETRQNERFARMLGQQQGPDAVIVGVLCTALLFGLIGLAAHFLWIVAIIVMALGLGYTVANSRRNRIDVANERAEGQLEPPASRTDHTP